MDTVELTRGDLIEIEWLDISESSVEDTRQAACFRRPTVAYFWEQKEQDGLTILVTTNTIDKDGPQQQGWTAYPMGCLLSVKLVKRAKKGRKRKPPATESNHA